MYIFDYQKNKTYFAQIAGHSEKVGARELKNLGARDIETAYKGAHFTADRKVLYKINYMARIITRVLAPLVNFHCPDTDILYDKSREVPWENIFTNQQSFAIFSNINIKSSQIYHSKYAALKMKDAIVDRFRDQTGQRPDVNTKDPDVVFNLYIQNDRATISLDTSGDSLHRRGYRVEGGPAPMQETVAATMLQLSDWGGKNKLYDPMCGSGTILCEALMKYCNIPAGYLRPDFGFQNLPDFDKSIWKQVKDKYDSNIQALDPGLIKGSDISSEMIKIARKNCSQLPYGDRIILSVKAFKDINNLENMTIVTNPPFGVRMGNQNNLEKLYIEFSKKLKELGSGSKVIVYSGKPKLLDNIWMKSDWTTTLVNGGLEGKAAQYQVY
ncbi:MAG TPA: THUMP domain-containing protein [bacterium]|nr:THUMP domain-containing protein [bacterium]